MKFTIMSKGDQSSDTLASTMKEYLLDFGFIMDEKEPDIVISVGGRWNAFVCVSSLL